MAIFNTVPPLHAGAGIKFDGLTISTAAAPRNLLDNSDFTNLVAQAGIGGNHGTVAYAADRWMLISGTVSYTAGTGLTLTGTIRQKLEFPPTGQISAFVGMASGEASISYDNGTVSITSSGGVIKWAALYEGKYTAETLPEYQPKGYGAELAECQRYYCKMQTAEDPVWLSCGHSGYASGPVRFPVQMRIKPTITVIAFRNVVSQDWPYTTVNCTKDGIGYVINNAENFSTDMTYYILFEASADL